MQVYLYFLTDKRILEKMTATYLLESMDHFTEPLDEGYFFYAFTNKKKVAKTFEKMRDMSKFYKKVVEMDDEEFSELKQNFYSFSALSFQSLLCSEHRHIVIPITTGEYWYCVEARSESIHSLMDIMNKVTPYIFTTKVKDLLGELQYVENMFPDMLHRPEWEYRETPTCDYMGNNGWKNELGVFLWLYSMLVIPANVLSEGIYE